MPLVTFAELVYALIASGGGAPPVVGLQFKKAHHREP